jgi:ankyrin repeat protein
VENVRAILETGKAEVDCFMPGATKLFWAAHAWKLDVIKLLLEHGADPNRRSTTDRDLYYRGDTITEERHLDCKRGPTPLHAFPGPRRLLYGTRVIFEDEEENTAACLRVLIEAGADLNATMDNEPRYGQNMTPLHLAVQGTEDGESWGDVDHAEEILTKLLLSAGANPNAKTKDGDTPLHLANMEKPRLLEILVEHGADINVLNGWGRSPLLEMINRLRWCYCSWNKVEPSAKLFHRLLELGTDVHLVDNEGDTIIHHILRSIRGFVDPKFMRLIKKLLREGVDLNRRNKKGQPPLWGYDSSASNADDEKVLRVLAGAGMDMNARDEKGRTFLWEATTQYSIKFETISKFIRLGADPGALTHDGSSLLHTAAAERKGPEWIRNPILAGARPDALEKHGNTLIHAVLRGPHMYDNAQEVLQVLVEAGALPLAKNVKGQSALHVVGNLDKLEIVLNTPAFRGLDISEPDLDGYTPLHHAARIHDKVVWRVLNAGADATALAADGVSPLHLAALSGNPGAVGLLIAKYRELNAIEKHIQLRCGRGKTPLHYACQSAIPEIVWIMLRNGAEARITDDKGLTPLHVLAELDPPKTSISRAGDIVGMLQLAGADVNAEAVLQAGDEKTSTTSTPLDIAVERKSWDVVRQLIAHGAEPRDSHRRSVDFVLATDKKKAAEQARNAQANVPRSQGRHRAWRGRWAACPGPKRPLEEGTHFITSGQDILDAKTQKGDDEASGTDILHRVLQDSDYDTVKEYAQLGGDMLELDHYRNHTFLHHLVDGGHADLLEYFGDKVAELEAQESLQKDEESCGTLLGTACERHLPSLQIIQLLVDKLGVDVNAVYNRRHCCDKLQGATALHILATSAYFWQAEALEYLISKGADIEARNKSGMTPLLAAIETAYDGCFWHEETVRILLRHGADVNATMKTTGSSALELSSQPGITKLLLENGASVESCHGRLTDVISQWMNPGIVELLLNAGVNPNELQPLQGKQSGKGQHEKRDEGVQNGDEAEQEYIEEPGWPRCYALHEAARPATSWAKFDFKPRQQAVIGLLVSHGADLYSPYPDGSFVLQAIVEERGEVRSLLAGLSHTNCNRKGHHGRTVLVSACAPIITVGPNTWTLDPQTASVMPCVVHALLDSGADPLAADNEGRTPLHWFCTFPGLFDEECREVFIALACHGPAAVKLSDSQERKPLHLALATYASGSQQSAFAIQHLLSLGADPGDPDPLTGNSALHFIAPRLVGESTAAATAAGLLRELAASVDINARNDAGETCVISFAAAGWEGTRDPKGKTPHPTYAIAHDTTHAKALDVFTDLGADLMAVDTRKRTLLHVTAGREARDRDRDQKIQDVKSAFEKLMRLGVDPRAEDDELRTAIDVAVARDLSGIVRLFSEEGKRMEENPRQKQNSQSESESEDDEFD